MRMEPEIVVAEMRRLGCPYAATDPSATVWLQGYQAGVLATKEIAFQVVRDELEGQR
jgi:hypothetical protein